jgi:hypothetical protein
MHDTRRVGRRHQFTGLGRGHRERLVRHHVFAGTNHREVHGVMQVVGRRIVHDLDVGVGNQRLRTAVGLRHVQLVGLLARRRLAARRNGYDIHVPEAPHGVQVMRADEASPDESHPDSCQRALLVRLQASGFRLRASGFRHEASSIRHQALGINQTFPAFISSLR